MKPRIRQQARFSALYIAVAVVVLIFLQSWLLTPPAQEIPMSRLVEWVREGRVARVSFGEREIRGVLKEPMPDATAPPPQWLSRMTGWTPGVLFVVVRIPGGDDASLLRELEAHKVEFSGRIESSLVRDLIFGWLLPIGVMAGIWIFLMRRMGGGPTQAQISRGDHGVWPDTDWGGSDDATIVWFDPTATGVATSGSRIATRTHFSPLKGRHSSRAMAMPSTTSTSRTPPVNATVRSTAGQKRSVSLSTSR